MLDPNDKFVLVRGGDDTPQALYKNGRLFICADDSLILDHLLAYLETEEREDPSNSYLDSRYNALPTLQEVEVAQAQAELEATDAVITTEEEWEERVALARRQEATSFTARLTPALVLVALHHHCSLTEEEKGEDSSLYTVTFS